MRASFLSTSSDYIHQYNIGCRENSTDTLRDGHACTFVVAIVLVAFWRGCGRRSKTSPIRLSISTPRVSGHNRHRRCRARTVWVDLIVPRVI